METFLRITDSQSTKEAVKALIEDIRNAMLAVSVNAPDKDTLDIAELAREILWTKNDSVPLLHWTQITQRHVCY